jgi:hypothetical protein
MDNSELEDELRPEYDLKSLWVRKLGAGRKSFGGAIDLPVVNIEQAKENQAAIDLLDSRLDEDASEQQQS